MPKTHQNQPISANIRPYPVSAYRLLKERFGTLLTICGGATRISDATRVGSSALYQMASTNEVRHFPPVDVIADLELMAGQPLITRELAALSGYSLMPIRPTKIKGSFSGILAKLGKEISDVFSDAAKALEDGSLTAREAKSIIKDVDEAVDVLEELRRGLKTVIEAEQTVFHDLMKAA